MVLPTFSYLFIELTVLTFNLTHFEIFSIRNKRKCEKSQPTCIKPQKRQQNERTRNQQCKCNVNSEIAIIERSHPKRITHS